MEYLKRWKEYLKHDKIINIQIYIKKRVEKLEFQPCSSMIRNNPFINKPTYHLLVNNVNKKGLRDKNY